MSTHRDEEDSLVYRVGVKFTDRELLWLLILKLLISYKPLTFNGIKGSIAEMWIKPKHRALGLCLWMMTRAGLITYNKQSKIYTATNKGAKLYAIGLSHLKEVVRLLE